MVKRELQLDDFEHNDIHYYETNHRFVKSYTLSISKEQAKVGKRSLKLTYDFGGWTSGNGGMYIVFKRKLVSTQRPIKFGLWVYGDGHSPWLRATFMDGNGARKIVNLTDDSIDWVGWKYVDLPIASSWSLPIRLEQIYAVETNKALQGNENYKGELYFDQLRFVYVDNEDLVGPVFTNISPEGDAVFQSSFTFSALVTDEMSGVDPGSICFLVNGEKVSHSYDEQTGLIKYPFMNVEAGSYHIVIKAKDYAGNSSKPHIDQVITVDLSPDIDEPILSDLTPREGSVLHTNQPRITCRVIDKKSGIAEADISVELNGVRLAITYHEDTGWCYGYPRAPLEKGTHQLIITVKDRAGNQLGPIKRQFTIHDVPTIKGSTFSIPIIPDTHSPDYAEYIFKCVTQIPAPFVIHMGDMVDQATKEEFQRMQTVLGVLEGKTMFPLAGNHEAFQGNLDLFTTYFGSPTYHVAYERILLIVLNSAYGQSIHQSDSTQIHYLRQVLKETEKDQIIIATHVPVKDDFDTSHGMNIEDAHELEAIVSAYKRENKQKQLLVLFGHLHVLQTWRKAGVDYVITGNGASKGYVANDQGNLLGYGVIDSSPTGMTYRFKPFVSRLKLQFDPNPPCSGQIKQGTSHQLFVYGHFNELVSDYTVDLTANTLVPKQWSSTCEAVIRVTQDGLIYGQKKGTAEIGVTINGVMDTIHIEVI